MARETVQNGAKFHRVILAWMDDSNVLYFCVLAWRDECELYRRSPMWPYLLFGYDEVRRVWCSVCIRQRRRKGMPGTYTGTGTHRGGVEPPREAVGRNVGLRMLVGKNLKHHQLLSLAMQHATYRLCHFHGTCYDESVAGLVLELQLNLIAP